jgi:hypothetical protein
MNNCHIESQYQFPGTPAFVCTGALGEIDMVDCLYVYTGSPGTLPYAHSTSPAPYGIKFRRPLWAYSVWEYNTFGFLSDNGGGNVEVIESKSLAGPPGSGATGNEASYWPGIDLSNTWALDPNFKQTGLVDYWAITGDTATVTSRQSGTNLTLTNGTINPYPGNTNVLTAVKSGTLTSTATFALLLPCIRNDNIGVNFPLAASGALGTLTFRLGYVNLLGTTGTLVPNFGYKDFISTLTAVTSTLYQTLQYAPLAPPAPRWATHAYIDFSMTNLSAGTLYVGQAGFYRF